MSRHRTSWHLPVLLDAVASVLEVALTVDQSINIPLLLDRSTHHPMHPLDRRMLGTDLVVAVTAVVDVVAEVLVEVGLPIRGCLFPSLHFTGIDAILVEPLDVERFQFQFEELRRLSVSSISDLECMEDRINKWRCRVSDSPLLDLASGYALMVEGCSTFKAPVHDPFDSDSDGWVFVP